MYVRQLVNQDLQNLKNYLTGNIVRNVLRPAMLNEREGKSYSKVGKIQIKDILLLFFFLVRCHFLNE